jgi:hypothetical protein
MNFFKLLDKLKRKEGSIILYCLLNRIPIFVFGGDSSKVNDLLIELSELIHFRKEFIFNTNFISINEYECLIQNEDIDYNSQRVQIRCPHEVSSKALHHFNSFDSWLTGILISNEDEILNYSRIISKKPNNHFLKILISSNRVSVEFVGVNLKLINLSFENEILQKISQDTENSIIRMKRVLSERIKLNNIDDEMIETLLNFDLEKIELKKNILRKEIQNFYSGSKRAFFILSRLNLLNTLEIKAKMGSRTLLETIDFEDVPIERILSFINKEWGEEFSHLIEDGNKRFIIEKIDSLWG